MHRCLIIFTVFACVFLGMSVVVHSKNTDTNPKLLHSPWSQGHRTYGMTASTPLPAPFDSAKTKTQLRIFKDDAGKNLGTSPWLILSEKKYKDRPNARTIWGASLKHVYKYVIDGEKFEYIDHFKIDGITSISWNVIGMHDDQGGKIIVPQPTGLSDFKYRGTPCFGRDPALLVFQDGATTDSPIKCVKKIELKEERLRTLCKPPEKWKMGYSGAAAAVLPTGELVTVAQFRHRWYQDDGHNYYMIVIDKNLSTIKSCGLISHQPMTNNSPGEYEGNGRSVLYYPAGDGIVKMLYDANTNLTKRVWKKRIPFRGRTGTTPTIVGTGKDRFIVVIDGRCAVGGTGNSLDVLTGKIRCSETDPSPSKLIAVSLSNPDRPPYIVSLPKGIDTVENSPSSTGNMVVFSNYGAYKPTTKTRGVVAAQWNPRIRNWEIAWHNPQVQMNGVTTISEATGLVYSSGMEEDGNVYMYGLKLKDGDGIKAGSVVFRKKVGPASHGWDAGNNTVINDDGSMLYCTNKGIARLLQR